MAARRRGVATTSTLARVNQTSIIEALKSSGALSRQQIGAMTGLSPATVNRLTADLLDKGIVANAGVEPSTGGRPSILLRFAGGTRVVVAVQLRAQGATGALVDLDGKIVFRREVSFGASNRRRAQADAPEGQPDSLRLTTELVEFLVETARGMATPCVAIGVAVPGVIQGAGGAVGRMPELGWDGLELGAYLRSRTTLPVVVENDANSLAYGESTRGAGQGLSSLVALVLENGLGSGIVTNGQLHRGANGEAGEIGYLLMERASFKRSYSDIGDLEDRIGSVALTRTARDRGIEFPAGTLVTAEDIFQRAREGDAAAAELAEEVLDMVAIAMAAIVIILDPQLVVVGSNFVGSAETVIPAIQQRLSGRIMTVPPMIAATHRVDAVLLGVAELAASEVNGFAYVAY
ncbi:ROK family protein [Leifsonia sp. L25]|uniref:ROK family protein n=1 Tax=Actinomycetes TaxID=1760 RepID=UPI003D688C22